MTAAERISLARASARHTDELDRGTDSAEAFRIALTQYRSDLRNSDVVKSLIADALATVAANHGITVDTLRGPQRHAEIVDARREAAEYLREELGLSYPKIGKALGGRDHSTIMSLLGWKRAKARHEAKVREAMKPDVAERRAA